MAARLVVQTFGGELAPIQLGVSIQRGCEAAVHALRQYIDDHRSKACRGQDRHEERVQLGDTFKACRVLEVCRSRVKFYTV